MVKDYVVIVCFSSYTGIYIYVCVRLCVCVYIYTYTHTNTQKLEANHVTAPLAGGPHTQIFGDSFGQSEPTFDPMCSVQMFSRI